MSTELSVEVSIRILEEKLYELREFLVKTDPAAYGMKKYENLRTIQKTALTLIVERDAIIRENANLRREVEQLAGVIKRLT